MPNTADAEPALPPPAELRPNLDAHFVQVVRAIKKGQLVAFLGAGANLCDRGKDFEWTADQRTFLPHGGELANHLAREFAYPPGGTVDLARVSQYVDLMMGTGPLYEELHSLFDGDYPPTSLHDFFATLPATLRAKGYSARLDSSRRKLLLVTTNYDDLLERAFLAAGQPFHVVVYEADGDHTGKFVHSPPGGAFTRIDRPNEYQGLVADEEHHPVILKIHGAVDRTGPSGDSYVITEDHYIEYLARTDISSLLPIPLATILSNSHMLFLGYGLRDWNLRVILHRLWGKQKLSWHSWAIQLRCDPLDQKFWQKRLSKVEILDHPLDRYIERLRQGVESLPSVGLTP